MEFFDLKDVFSINGEVHCPGGGVCNASGCSKVSMIEIDNNDLILNGNSAHS